jgi:hypothetical protein
LPSFCFSSYLNVYHLCTFRLPAPSCHPPVFMLTCLFPTCQPECLLKQTAICLSILFLFLFSEVGNR